MIFGRSKEEAAAVKALHETLKEDRRREAVRNNIIQTVDRLLMKDHFAWLPRKMLDGRWIWLEKFEPMVKVSVSYLCVPVEVRIGNKCVETTVVREIQQPLLGLVGIEWFKKRTLDTFANAKYARICYKLIPYRPAGAT